MAWPYHLAAWRRLRLAKLAEQPLCEVCTRRGQIVEATVVDHAVAIAKGGEAFPTLDGLMSLCASCHGFKTAAKDNPHAFGGGGHVAFKGCGIDGLPIDPNHPAYALPPCLPSSTGGRVEGRGAVASNRRGHTQNQKVREGRGWA